MAKPRKHPEGTSQVAINKLNREALRTSGGRIITLHLPKETVDDLAIIRHKHTVYKSDAAVIAKLITLMAAKIRSETTSDKE